MPSTFSPWPLTQDYQLSNTNALTQRHNLLTARQNASDEMLRRNSLVERSNAMGQPVASYPDYQAKNELDDRMTAEASLFYNAVSPMITKAFETGEDGLREKVVTMMNESKNPKLNEWGQVLGSMKFTAPSEGAMLFDLGKEGEAERFNKFFPGSELPEGESWKGWVHYKMKNGVRMIDKTTEAKQNPQKPLVKTWPIDDKGTMGTFSYNYDTKQWDLLDTGKKVTLGSMGGKLVTPQDIPAIAKAVREGRLTIKELGAAGSGVKAAVVAYLENSSKLPGEESVHYTGDISEQKANASSQAFVTKQLDMTQSFLETIDANILQLKEHISSFAQKHNLDQNRIMTMGVRTFNEKLKGDSNFSIYDMLLNAITTENAKLQAGGAGSVAQVAEGARIEMEKAHDKNLPVSEMLKLLEATRREGDNRFNALKKQHEISRERANKSRMMPTKGSVDFSKITTRNGALSAVAQLKRKGATDAQIREMAKGTQWEKEL